MILKSLNCHRTALAENKEKKVPDTSKITIIPVITKWTDVFHSFFAGVVGDRTISLAYVIRSEVAVLIGH